MDKLERSTKVLLQLSGGKDSVACLILLKKEQIYIEAIHFVHQYGYDIPTKMSVMACEHLNVKLHIIDINNEIENILLNNFQDRPCQYCKAIMDQITVDFASSKGFNAICVGDNADDIMVINRATKIDGGILKKSRYLNAKVVLPHDILIYRPLIDKNSSYSLSLVTSVFSNFARVNDTGDKYFEYSREGCPLQFKDLGACYTKVLMHNLKKMNILCSKFATQKGIRASIHLPSEHIVTIPKGYEDECKCFLIKNGCKLNNHKVVTLYTVHISISLYFAEDPNNLLKMSVQRLCERINLQIINKNVGERTIEMYSDNTSVMAFYNNRFNVVNIIINSTDDNICINNYNNICLEIFHTSHVSISNSVIR